MNCQALTRTKTPCKRKATAGNYCWQHQSTESKQSQSIPDLDIYLELIKLYPEKYSLQKYQQLRETDRSGQIYPYTLNYLQKIEDINEQVLEKYWTDKTRLNANYIYISIESLIKHNSSYVIPPTENEFKINENYYKYNEDKILAKFFPIIGSGTQSLVFDIGTCVLKRIEDQNRGTWEMDLESRYKFVKAVSVIFPLKINNTNIYFLAQEKLEPIDPKKYDYTIKELYFPEADNDFWKYWEWGLDANGKPKVLDWG